MIFNTYVIRICLLIKFISMVKMFDGRLGGRLTSLLGFTAKGGRKITDNNHLTCSYIGNTLHQQTTSMCGHFSRALAH